MTQNRDLPERRPNPGQAGRVPRRPPIPKFSEAQSRPLPPPPKPSAARVPVPPPPPMRRPLPKPTPPEVRPPQFGPGVQYPPPGAEAFSRADRLEPTSPDPQSPSQPSDPPRKRFTRTWQFWAISSVVVLMGISVGSVALLLKLPAIPNCPSIFWPTASASLRLYCAQLAANKQTTDDLLEAIALVNSLPQNHPLRPDINRHIEEWSTTILDLSETAFDQGDLQKAIDSANRIPLNTPAHALVDERIKRWQTIWNEAEQIFTEAENALRAQDLRKAFDIAVQLLSVENEYWKTTKYDELNGLINATREDAAKLARARNLLDRGGLSNLGEAVKLAEQIKQESYAYSEAQRLIVDVGQKMLDMAEDALNQQDADEALAILRQIPERANLQEEARDFNTLASAYSQAWGGTVADLQSAIVEAQRLRPDRPLYGRAQSLINRWQLEIQDVGHLDAARRLAELGGVSDLRAAIAEAQLVPRGNPRYQEARDAIARWSSRAETIEDQPYLDQADRLASLGDMESLQAAVNEASRISEGRALYSEARRRIRDWTSQIQRTQDQPYLDQARRLAALGNIPDAIATAQQIQSGRALYDEAQDDIQTWRNQIQGQSRMQDAYQSAGIGTTSALLAAIREAQQVSSDSPTRAEADRMIAIWSQEILRLAEQQANYDLEGAIATAESIPPRTEAYAQAQLQIQQWQQLLDGEQ